MEQTVKILAASMCITEEEAMEILTEDGRKYIVCTCPTTGTIEYMEVIEDERK